MPITKFEKDGFYYADKSYKSIVGLNPKKFTTSINFPPNTEIEQNVFENLESNFFIASVFVPASCFINPLTFNTMSSSRNIQMGEITFEEGTEQLFDRTLFGSPFLSVNLPKSLKVLGKYCMANMPNLVDIDLTNVEIIKEGAFEASGLKSVDILDSVKIIEEDAFRDCRYLKNVFYNSSCNIPRGAFLACLSLDNFKFGAQSKITEIGVQAFNNTKLSSFDFIPSINKIDSAAFANTDFEEVLIPPSMRYIRSDAFASCKKLTKFTISEDGNPLMLYDNILAYSSVKSLTIPKRVISLDEQTCAHMKKLETLDIQAPVKEIPYMFAVDCVSLEFLTLSPTVTLIDNHAFNDTNIKNLNFEHVKHYIHKCFGGTMLEEFVVYDDVDFASNIFDSVKTVIAKNKKFNLFNFPTYRIQPDGLIILNSEAANLSQNKEFLEDMSSENFKVIILQDQEINYLLSLDKIDRDSIIDILKEKNYDKIEDFIKDNNITSFRKISVLNSIINSAKQNTYDQEII